MQAGSKAGLCVPAGEGRTPWGAGAAAQAGQTARCGAGKSPGIKAGCPENLRHLLMSYNLPMTLLR